MPHRKDESYTKETPNRLGIGSSVSLSFQLLLDSIIDKDTWVKWEVSLSYRHSLLSFGAPATIISLMDALAPRVRRLREF